MQLQPLRSVVMSNGPTLIAVPVMRSPFIQPRHQRRVEAIIQHIHPHAFCRRMEVVWVVCG